MISSVTKRRPKQETVQRQLVDEQAIFHELEAAMDASVKSDGRRMTVDSAIFKYLCDHQQLFFAEITMSDCQTPKSFGSSRRLPFSRSQVSLAQPAEPLLGNLGVNENAPSGLTLRGTKSHDSALPGLRNTFNNVSEHLLELLLATFTAYHYVKKLLDAQLPIDSKTIAASKCLLETDSSSNAAGCEGIPRKARATLGMGLTTTGFPGTDLSSPSKYGGTRLHEKTVKMVVAAESLWQLGKLVVAECAGVKPPVAAVLDALAYTVDAVVRSAEEGE